MSPDQYALTGWLTGLSLSLVFFALWIGTRRREARLSRIMAEVERTALDRHLGCVTAVLDIQLGQDASHVALDGEQADGKLTADFLVALSLDDKC